MMMNDGDCDDDACYPRCVCVFFVPLVTIPYQAAAWQVGM